MAILIHILNLSLSTCTFSSIWKIFITVLIYKKKEQVIKKLWTHLVVMFVCTSLQNSTVETHFKFFNQGILLSQHVFIRGRKMETNLVSFFFSHMVCQRVQVDTIFWSAYGIWFGWPFATFTKSKIVRHEYSTLHFDSRLLVQETQLCKCTWKSLPAFSYPLWCSSRVHTWIDSS